MDSFTPTSANSKSATGINPFARALTEVGGTHSTPKDSYSGSGLLNEPSEMTEDPQSEWKAKQEQRTQQLRAELQKQNALELEAHNVFSRKEAEVTSQLEQARQEINALIMSGSLSKTQTEVAVAAFQQVRKPGIDGSGFFSFFQKFREHVILLRQQAESSSTWAKTAKKKKSSAPGMEIQGKQYEQTSTIQDMMTNSERNLATSGN